MSSIVQIDNIQHDLILGEFNSLVFIDATHLILAYQGDGNDGFIKTFSIDSNFKITEIDSLEHDNVLGSHNSLIKLDDTHFVIAYRGADNDGFLRTIEIDSNFNITALDKFEYDAVLGGENSLVKIDNTHFLLAYSGSPITGVLKTFSVDGSFVITEIDSLAHDGTDGRDNSLVKIDDTHYILAFNKTIKTFVLDGSFNITEIDSLVHNTQQASNNSLVKIDDTHYVLAYNGNAVNGGFIKTFILDGSFNITELKVIEHDSSDGRFNSLVLIDPTTIVLAYGQIGIVKTFNLDGDLNIAQVEQFQHDGVKGTHNSLVKIDLTHYILAYEGDESDGFIKTFSIDPILSSEALTTLFSVKEFLGITNTNDDSLLQSLIDGISEQIKGMLGGRRIAEAIYTNEVHDGGEQDIFLENFPIQDSPVLIAEFRSGTVSNPTFQAFTENAFVIYKKAGYVHFFGRTQGRHLHGDKSPLSPRVLAEGDRNLRFTYKAGFATIPADLELLANQLVASVFNRRNAQGIKKETVEGTSVEYFGDQNSGGANSLLTAEQKQTIKRYRRYNVGQNL